MISTIARRYAQALHEQASEQNAIATVDNDVDVLRDTLESSPDLAGALASPVVSRASKERIVQSVFGSHLSKSTLHFLDFVIEKGREDLLPDITEAYRHLRNTQEGIIEAHVKAAFDMAEAEQASLRQVLEARTGKKVRLRVAVAPELIGGIVIRIGDTVYDGSVRNKLAELRERMDTPGVSLN